MRVRLCTIALLTTIGISRPADGQTWTWTGNLGFGLWNATNNWSPTTVPSSNQNAQLVFGTSASTTAMNNSIPGTFMLNILTFNAGAPAYTLIGNGLDFRRDSGGVNPSFVMNSGNSVTFSNTLTLTHELIVSGTGTGSLTLNGAIVGPGALRHTGDGTLTLGSGSNTYAGVTWTEGTLALGVGNAIPIGGTVVVYSGGQLSIGGVSNSAASAIGMLGLSDGTLRAATGSGDYYLNRLQSSGLGSGIGGVLNFSGSNTVNLRFVSSSPSIEVFDNSTWSSGIASRIWNSSGSIMALHVSPGVTLTNAISLEGGPFRVIGGGTWYQAGGDFTSSTVYVEQGRLRFDVPGALGVGSLSLTGGTLQYTGPTATVTKSVVLYYETSAVEVTNAATVLTWSGPLFHFGSITKDGAGTLVLSNTASTYSGGTTVRQGVLQVAGDGSLGSAATGVTVNAFGALRYAGDTTTSRTFTLNNGSLEVPTGVTLNLNGAAIAGGLLRGGGTYTLLGGAVVIGANASTSTNINVTGPASITNVILNGNMTIAAGQTLAMTATTVGSGGRMTVNGTANVIDFVSNGQITIPAGGSVVNPTAASSGIVLGGGSTTFIGTPAAPGGVLNVGPQPMLVRGGLLVNNGIIGNNTGNGIVIVDYGGLAKGTGYYDTIPQTINGGKFSPGNSPGRVTVGSATLNPGGNYDFEINNATGTPGPTGTTNLSGWDLTLVSNQINAANSNLTVTATPQNPFTFNVITLRNPSPPDVADVMANFNPNVAQRWLAFDVNPAGSVTNWDPTAVVVNTSQIVNSLIGSFTLERDTTNTFQFYLTYTPVPEPGAVLAVTGFAAVFAGTFRCVRNSLG